MRAWLTVLEMTKSHGDVESSWFWPEGLLESVRESRGKERQLLAEEHFPSAVFPGRMQGRT